MLVILKENVVNLGQTGDVVRVSDGYARNYLIPQNLCNVANESNVKELEHHKRQLEKRRQSQLAEAQQLSSKISGLVLSLGRKTSADDKIFGSVTTNDIAVELKKHGVDIDKRLIEFLEPIKALGDFTVNVKLQPEVVASVKVSVVKQD